jgi:hypothetical protein
MGPMEKRKPASNEIETTAGAYVEPRIQTYSPEEFLNLLGPAQGYAGNGNGHGHGHGHTTQSAGRGPRLFPGIR